MVTFIVHDIYCTKCVVLRLEVLLKLTIHYTDGSIHSFDFMIFRFFHSKFVSRLKF